MRISDWSSDVCSSDLHAPQVAAAVVVTARHQDLRFGDGRGRGFVVLQRQRGAGEYFRFPAVQRDCLHGIAGFLRSVETVQDFVIAFDDVPGYVARSEEHKSELQSLMGISYAGFRLK